MSYGWVEECGIRCNYHGWKYDESGACVHQPFEEIAHPDARFKDRITIKAYPVQEHAGMLWTYMGPPDKQPLLPNYEPFTRTNCFRQIVLAEIPCNWFQCHENTIDPIHFEWLHDHWGRILQSRTDGPQPTTHLRLNFVEFEHGFQYQRIREGQSEEDELWTVGRVSLWPHGFYLGGHFEWRIPIDDDKSLSILWHCDRVPREMEPFEQPTIPYWYAPLKDEKTGRWLTSHVVNQDFVGWVGQGTVADRTREHLGESDRGIILLRRRMLEEAHKVERGEDPKALVRDPGANECVPLPAVGLQAYREGRPFADVLKSAQRFQQPGRALGEFPFFAQQPAEIREAYVRAMGFDRVPEPNGRNGSVPVPTRV